MDEKRLREIEVGHPCQAWSGCVLMDLVAEVRLVRAALCDSAAKVISLVARKEAAQAEAARLRLAAADLERQRDEARARVVELEAHPRCELCGANGLVCPVCEESRIL